MAQVEQKIFYCLFFPNYNFIWKSKCQNTLCHKYSLPNKAISTRSAFPAIFSLCLLTSIIVQGDKNSIPRYLDLLANFCSSYCMC